jgi:hypothetical protein
LRDFYKLPDLEFHMMLTPNHYFRYTNIFPRLQSRMSKTYVTYLNTCAYGAGWHSGNARHLHSEGARVESGVGYYPEWGCQWQGYRESIDPIGSGLLCLSLQLPALAASSLVDFSTLEMEAIRSSETSVYTRSTRRHISDNGILHSHGRENLKSYTNLLVQIICFWTLSIVLSIYS